VGHATCSSKPRLQEQQHSRQQGGPAPGPPSVHAAARHTALVLAEARERPLWQRWRLRAVKLWNLALTARKAACRGRL
jgi:hypothetical protein